MGKLCNNTQSFVIEKRAGGRKPRKKGAGAGNARYRSWQVWTSLSPQLTMRKLRLRNFEVIISSGYKSSLLLTSTLVNYRVQIGVISNCMMHTILVWKLEVLSKGPYLRPVHCTRCARSCSREYLLEPCLTVASLFPRGLFVSGHVVLSSRIAKMHWPRRPESSTLPVHCWKANREANNDTIGVISGIWFNTVFFD